MRPGPILHLKFIIKLSETLWYQFQMAAYSSGINQNFLQKNQVTLKKTWAKWTKTRLKTVIYMHESLKRSWQIARKKPQ